ncbi:MAG: isochorismatase family protein [Deltaproteobacteria bacterium]|nr:isochorismatase family protein [Deltaproteobacteria bacterium]
MTRARDILKWHAELAREDVEPHPAYSLYRESTALLIVDMQEKLGAAMPEEPFARAVKNTVRLIETARAFELPILVTEQYAKGLGPTVPAILEALPEGTPVVEKMGFSCAEVEDIQGALEARHRRQVIVVGQETHVCVFQTVRDLVELGWFVHVARDGCTSRTKENWKVGLELMHGLGATISGTETVLFDLLQTAEDPHFKALSKLVR